MSNDFIRNALSWGDGGQRWLDSIPNLIAQYETEWNLTIKEPFNLSYNYVVPAIDSNGNECVIKIGYPEDKEFKTEIAALSVFNGEKAVKLLKTSERDPIVLLEHVLPGQPLSELLDDDKATKILCEVVKKLHKPLPNNLTGTP